MPDETTRIEGPVTGGTRDHPYSAPEADLEALGYVMEEFFLEGAVPGYEPVPGTELGRDGRWEAQRADAGDFRTRILVVRPAEAARFNGTVIVHWLNVTAGRELGSADNDEILNGFAWVGVSAQKVGIDGFPGGESPYPNRLELGDHLKGWDEERYGSLRHPGDRYSYGIFTQAARAVGPDRERAPVDPMGGLGVERLVATGPSQSAARLTAYINAVHPIERVFHAFMPTITSGGATPLGETAARTAAAPRPGQRPATFIRDDIDEPVMVVNSEAEAEGFFRVRRPDTDRFRFWEVAGVPHATLQPGAGGGRGTGGRKPNPMSYKPVLTAAYRHMQRWLVDGTPPPVQPRIEIEPGEQPQIRRDRFGNALGGIRPPHIAAPVAEYHGRNADAPGLGALFGWMRPFTDEELRSLWSSREEYIAAYHKAVEDLAASGAIRPEDAEPMKEEAHRVELNLG